MASLSVIAEPAKMSTEREAEREEHTYKRRNRRDTQRRIRSTPTPAAPHTGGHPLRDWATYTQRYSPSSIFSAFRICLTHTVTRRACSEVVQAGRLLTVLYVSVGG